VHGTTFSSLSSCRNASSIGLLCKLQDLLCRDPLQSFSLALRSIKYPYSFRHVEDDDFLLQQLTRTLRQRTLDERWTNLC